MTLLLIPIDRSNPSPLYRQVCERIVELIEQGVLRSGDRLPPTRSLAGVLGVHRTTGEARS